MNLRRFAGASALVALAFATLAGGASARTLVVHPGQSIQNAIDEARGGDTVIVQAGTYRESVDVNKGIRLHGQGAVLRSGRPGRSLCNRGQRARTAICVHGKLSFGQQGAPTLERRVRNVTISGFRVRGFSGDGVFGFGTSNLRVRNNRFTRNGGYGVFSLNGRGTRAVHNVVRRNGDFGIYVGDSPRARAVVRNNYVSGSQGGIFLRHASIGRVAHNVVTRNCVGIFVLADAPGPAAHWRITANRVIANNRGCPAEEGEGPPFSGLGILVSGARDVLVQNNVVRRHRRLHPTIGTGGIAIVSGDRSAPRRVLVRHNLALANANDLFWDRSGGVRFVDNQCRRSSPRRLCR